MNFGERLRLARNAKRLNQTQLGEAADIRQSYVSELESLEEAPPKADLSKIAAALEVSEDYLRHGLISNVGEPMPVCAWDDSTVIPSDMVAIPFYKEVELSAGGGSSCIIEKDNGRKLWFSKSFLDRKGADYSNAVCLPIIGDSMSPRFESGGVVVVDMGCQRIIDGDIYAINYQDHLFFKRVNRLTGSTLLLISENPEYSTISADVNDVSIIGRVINYMKEF